MNDELRTAPSPSDIHWVVRWQGPLFALIALLYIGTSTGPAIFDETEGQYSAAAREMLERGDWLVPSNDTIPRLQKPPLVYHTQIVCMKLFGINEFSARLPNALFSLLWFFGVYLIGKTVFDRATGVMGAVMLATMMGTYIFCHLIMPEPFLAAFLTFTFWCFLKAHQSPSNAGRWMAAAWIFMALGTFSKGVHGLLYPLAAAGVVYVWLPATREVWRKLINLPGFALFLLIVLPWYLAIEFRYPGFLCEHFVNEQIGHLFDARYPPDSERVPFLVFAVQHLIFFAPWILFVPSAVRILRRHGPEQRLGVALLLAWAGVTVLSILPSALQDYYTMTCWGALALFLARPWARAKISRGEIMAGTGLFALASLVALAVGIWLRAQAGSLDEAAEPVAARDNIINALQGFSAGVWQNLTPLLFLTALALAIGAIGCGLALRHRLPAAWAGTVAMMLLISLCAARGLGAVEDYFSLKQVAHSINERLDADAMVVAQDEMRLNTSLLFYLDRLPVHWIDADPDAEFPPRVLGLGRELYVDETDLARAWGSGRQVFLVVEQESMPRWRELLSLSAAEAEPLAISGTRVVIVNRSP